MSADDASCVLSPLTVRWSGLCRIIYICVLFLLAALWDVIFTFRGSLTVALGLEGREKSKEKKENGYFVKQVIWNVCHFRSSLHVRSGNETCDGSTRNERGAYVLLLGYGWHSSVGTCGGFPGALLMGLSRCLPVYDRPLSPSLSKRRWWRCFCSALSIRLVVVYLGTPGFFVQ